MFDKLKKLLKKEEISQKPLKPVIITIHGYGRRRQHEFDNLALWGQADGFQVVQFDMYDLFDAEDNDWMIWVSRAKEQVDVYKNSGRDVYLVGFSMGGVIAAYLATMCETKKLILLAPAFSYMNMDTITGAITKSYNAFITKGNEKKDEIELPRSFYIAFMDLVKNLKKYIAQVSCPVLFLHGDMDEVIATRSSISAYDKIMHDQKKLVILHQGHHRLLMDTNVNWECYQIMKLFFDGVLLHNQKIEQADDIMDELLQEYHRRQPAMGVQQEEVSTQIEVVSNE